MAEGKEKGATLWVGISGNKPHYIVHLQTNSYYWKHLKTQKPQTTMKNYLGHVSASLSGNLG